MVPLSDWLRSWLAARYAENITVNLSGILACSFDSMRDNSKSPTRGECA